jgi:predicted Zn-dependent protease
VSFLRRAGILAVLALALLEAACETVPVTGRKQLILLSAEQEAEMGVQSYRDIIGKAKVSADPEKNALVRRVGSRIAAVTGRTDLKWEYTVVDDDRQVNAFALPGGKIAVYTGMLPVARDEAGLAAVVGHEVAHVIARHGGERVSQQVLVQTGLEAAMAAFGGGNAATVQLIGAALGAGASYGIILPFGRAQESEADRLGLTYMAKAGYDPRAARDLWLRMADAAKGQRVPEFLSTHPAEATRVRQIEEWLPEALKHYQPPR